MKPFVILPLMPFGKSATKSVTATSGKLSITHRLVLALAIGLVTLLATRLLSAQRVHPDYAMQREAATLMARCTAEVRHLREAIGQPLDAELDPNRTGLIGPEYAELTTTLGNIEAKRTSTNPVFAALMVRYFKELGLKQGDVVAVGASGSFPAMTLATLCAARVLDLRPVIIYSLGASMYGAGSKDCTLLEMLARWREQGLLPYTVHALSLGGDNDQAGGLIFPEARVFFLEKARTSGVPFINEADLAASEQARLRLYQTQGQVRCFVNVGGASVNMGNKSFALRLTSGLVQPREFAPLAASSNGLVAHYLREGVPVIHLLDMRHLALKNGIPIDPKPLPPLGTGAVYTASEQVFSEQISPEQAFSGPTFSGATGTRAALLTLGLGLCLAVLTVGRKKG